MKNNNYNQEVVWLLNEKYGGQLTPEAEKDIARLKRGEPVDYVIGHKKFCGCQIDLRYKPLIPREETEHWVKQAIAEMAKGRPRGGSPRAALDMFAGSGCCGIAVLKNAPNSHCDFVDVDDNCLKQIRLNLKINNINKNRYRVIKSNIFEKLSKSDFDSKKYDVILANPPYIGLAEKKKVQKSVLSFEPKQALFAKQKGLYFIAKFLSEAKNYLTPEGFIYLEFGYNQKKEIEKLLKKFGYSDYQFEKDQFGKWRFVKICIKK
ncbi:MAG: peptide chain release factor N(5)-glutamine methyltransferase [Candidatus Gribaldobacteria bacterium]|nr:peptide chain release factor N(5)-glutamine methyltransferase [Candidatus Gribaldobacteria bacterium]